jgi:hypothetical protein
VVVNEKSHARGPVGSSQQFCITSKPFRRCRLLADSVEKVGACAS